MKCNTFNLSTRIKQYDASQNIQIFPNNEDITKCDTNMIRLCNFFCGKPTKNKISSVE